MGLGGRDFLERETNPRWVWVLVPLFLYFFCYRGFLAARQMHDSWTGRIERMYTERPPLAYILGDENTVPMQYWDVITSTGERKIVRIYEPHVTSYKVRPGDVAIKKQGVLDPDRVLRR